MTKPARNETVVLPNDDASTHHDPKMCVEVKCSIDSDPEGIDAAAMLADGDTAALQKVMTDICPDVQKSLRKKFYPSLKDEDIEDALSVALSRLWFFRSLYDRQRATLHDYFYIIARNAAVDILRLNVRQSKLIAGAVKGTATIRAGTFRRRSTSHFTTTTLQADALAQALQELPATDRDILFAYALGEGCQPWATNVADEFGVPASTIRVRRLRLMQKLRRRLLLEDAEGSGDDRMIPDHGRKTPRSIEALSHEFLKHRKELSEILAAVRAHWDEDSKHVDSHDETPFGHFKRMWNESVDDETIHDPSRLATLQALGPWLKDVECSNAKLRKQSQQLVERCREKRAKWPISAEQVERSLIGLSQAFQREMPEATAREGHGQLIVKWEKGAGTARWCDTASQNRPFNVVDAMRNSADYHGKIVDKKAREALISQMEHDLRAGRLVIPAFEWNRDKSRPDVSVLEWRLAKGRSPSIELPKRNQKFQVADRPPTELEMDLWSKHPVLAELVDEALCVAVQIHDSETGDRIRQQLVQVIQEATGNSYSSATVAAMLLPFVDRQWANRDPSSEEVAALAEAFDFLAAELQEPESGQH
jgi:RNA polymerase sigma factor (sigma-70 family)